VHPFRFAVRTTGTPTAAAWLARARRVEELGYSTLVVVDHLIRQLAPIPALVAAAAATTTLRLGVHVFDNDLRNPVMLANEIATLDALSGGRLELGIGAGWRRTDYAQTGIPYDAPKVRIDRLVEAIAILKRLFNGDRVDFDGVHYRLRGARLGTPVVQRPHPPLVIGGGGPRILGIAAREADIVSFIPRMSARGRPTIGEATTAATEEKVARVRRAAGDRFDRLELCAFVLHVNVADRSPLGAIGARVEGLASGAIDTPYLLAGTRSSVREQLLRLRERLGISYWTIPASGMEGFAPVVEDLAGR